MSVRTTDLIIQDEAVTTHSRKSPTVPALRKLKFWENPSFVCSAVTDLNPADNVNTDLRACANVFEHMQKHLLWPLAEETCVRF